MPTDEFPAPDVAPKETAESRRKRYDEFRAGIAAGQSEVQFVQADKKPAPGRSIVDDAKALESSPHAPPAKPEGPSNRERREAYSNFLQEARPQRSDLLSEVDQGAIDKAEARMQENLADSLSAEVAKVFGRWVENFKRDYKPAQDIELEDMSGAIDE